MEYDNGERELYDLGADPFQLENIYVGATPELKKQLSAWLASLRHAHGEALREAEEMAPKSETTEK